MSLDTYENLTLEIIDWSHRNDVSEKIDTFINLAETEMFTNTEEPLKLRGGETRVAFSTNITDRFASLPDGYQSSRKLRIQVVNGESVELKYRTPSQLQLLSSTGMPRFFTVTDQIEFDRVSDQVYTGEMQFFQNFTPLSSSNSSNFVLTSYPNIYLFGALWALKEWGEEPQEAAGYYQKFLAAVVGANGNDADGRYGPAPVMRIEGVIP